MSRSLCICQDKTSHAQDTPPQDAVLMVHLQTPARVGEEDILNQIVTWE